MTVRQASCAVLAGAFAVMCSGRVVIIAALIGIIPAIVSAQQNVSDVDFSKTLGFPPFFLIPAGFALGIIAGLAIVIFGSRD